MDPVRPFLANLLQPVLQGKDGTAVGVHGRGRDGKDLRALVEQAQLRALEQPARVAEEHPEERKEVKLWNPEMQTIQLTKSRPTTTLTNLKNPASLESSHCDQMSSSNIFNSKVQ